METLSRVFTPNKDTEVVGSNSKVFSLFIDNQPEDLSTINFKDLFSSFRDVLDAYISDKFGRKFGRKYGFSIFAGIIEGMKAIEHMNGKIVGDCKLQVTWGRFQKRSQPRGSNKSNSPQKKSVPKWIPKV